MRQAERKRTADAEYAQAREVVYARSRGLCEIRAAGCDDVAVLVHHVQRRAQGVNHSPDNLKAACSNCHIHLHANPADAYAAGWLRRSTANLPE